MKIGILRRTYDCNAVRASAVMAIADAPREFSQLRGYSDFGAGEIPRLKDNIIVAETMKLNELWRHDLPG